MRLKFQSLATKQSKLTKDSSKLRQRTWSLKRRLTFVHYIVVVPVSNYSVLGEQDGSVKFENTSQKCEVCVYQVVYIYNVWYLKPGGGG